MTEQEQVYSIEAVISEQTKYADVPSSKSIAQAIYDAGYRDIISTTRDAYIKVLNRLGEFTIFEDSVDKFRLKDTKFFKDVIKELNLGGMYENNDRV